MRAPDGARSGGGGAPQPATPLDATGFARLAADPGRLAVLGALATRSRDLVELGEVTGLDTRRLARALARLRAVGLVEERKARLFLAQSALRGLVAGLPQATPANLALLVNLSPDDARAISPFFSGRRLVEIPASPARRAILLQVLVDEFEPGRYYAEAEVRRILRRFHPDDAALRRYLVDGGLLARENETATYWRGGGPAPSGREIPPPAAGQG